MTEVEYGVYVLECKASTGRVTIHVGIAIDPNKRLLDHRAGRVKATRGRSIQLLGCTDAMPIGEALAAEACIKKLPPNKKRAWIRKNKKRGKF